LRLYIDSIFELWLLIICVVIPAFIFSVNGFIRSIELRLMIWLITICVAWIVFQFYCMQGGSNYGASIFK